MRRAIWMSLAVIMLGWLATASAQSTPDLSGQWSMNLDRSQSPTFPGFDGPVLLVIEQTPETVSIETIRGDDHRSTTQVYTLHDSAPAETGTAAAKALAYWDGPTLVAEGLKEVQGKTVNTRQRLALDPSGDGLHVMSMVIVQHGYTIEGARNFGEAEDYYTRVK